MTDLTDDDRPWPGSAQRKAEMHALYASQPPGIVLCTGLEIPTETRIDMSEIQIEPIDINCPVCEARKSQSCQERDGFVSPAHASRQVAAIAALATGEAKRMGLIHDNTNNIEDKK